MSGKIPVKVVVPVIAPVVGFKVNPVFIGEDKEGVIVKLIGDGVEGVNTFDISTINDVGM